MRAKQGVVREMRSKLNMGEVLTGCFLEDHRHPSPEAVLLGH